MLKKVSSALNTAPTTPHKLQTFPKTHKNPQKKAGEYFWLGMQRDADESKELETALSRLSVNDFLFKIEGFASQ